MALCKALFSRNVHGPIKALLEQSKMPQNKLNLLASNIRSLKENIKPRPYRIDLAIAQSIRQGLSLSFSRNDRTLV